MRNFYLVRGNAIIKTNTGNIYDIYGKILFPVDAQGFHTFVEYENHKLLVKGFELNGISITDIIKTTLPIEILKEKVEMRIMESNYCELLKTENDSDALLAYEVL